MTAETLKPFLSLSMTTPYKKQATVKDVRLWCCSIFVVTFCITISGLEIWNSLKAVRLQQEVNQLREALDDMKKRIGFDILEDLEDFENIYRSDRIQYDNDNDNDFSKFDSLDVDDDDEDSIYDLPNTTNETYDDDDDDDEDDDDMNNNDSIFDDSKKRKSRSVDQNVRIIDEPYALRRNKTGSMTDAFLSKTNLNKQFEEPKLLYDWNKKQETPSFQPHRYPKKYQAHRAAPTEYVQQPQTMVIVENDQSEYPQKQKFDTTKLPDYIFSRGSRVMHTRDDKSKAFRQIIKKSDYDKIGKPMQIVQQRHVQQTIYGKKRNIRPMYKSMDGKGRSGQARLKTIAVHYSGDTSRYVAGRHEHYEGNGRLRHPGGVYGDWLQSAWVNNLAMDRFFKLDNGVVTIRENGLYFIYAQIFYHDDHDTNGFVVEQNNQTILQCTTMTYSIQRVTKSNTCYTAGAAYLRVGDTIHINDLGNHRFTLFEPSKSFFGLVKLGDARPL